MRSHLTWLTSGLIAMGLVLAAPTVAGAQDETVTPTTAAETTATLPELAPGESPGGLDQESGPMLTLLVEEPSTETSATDVAPAGPVVFDPVGSNAISNNSKTVLFLLILTAVPSLSLGTALWIHKDQALVRRNSNR